MRFASEAGTYLQVIPAVDPQSGEAEDLVRAIRDVEAPVELALTGPSAALVDQKDAHFLATCRWPWP